ncbi:UNVERIFIED_CONTAM: hypothetical protein FKN15_076979 [Acipenser sinensis]
MQGKYNELDSTREAINTLISTQRSYRTVPYHLEKEKEKWLPLDEFDPLGGRDRMHHPRKAPISSSGIERSAIPGQAYPISNVIGGRLRIERELIAGTVCNIYIYIYAYAIRSEVSTEKQKFRILSTRQLFGKRPDTTLAVEGEFLSLPESCGQGELLYPEICMVELLLLSASTPDLDVLTHVFRSLLGVVRHSDHNAMLIYQQGEFLSLPESCGQGELLYPEICMVELLLLSASTPDLDVLTHVFRSLLGVVRHSDHNAMLIYQQEILLNGVLHIVEANMHMAPLQYLTFPLVTNSICATNTSPTLKQSSTVGGKAPGLLWRGKVLPGRKEAEGEALSHQLSSSWHVAPVHLPLVGQNCWPHMSEGFSVSLWMNVESPPEAESSAEKEKKQKRTKLVAFRDSSVDSIDGDKPTGIDHHNPPSSGDKLVEDGCLHIISLGSKALILQVWADLNTGAFIFRKSEVALDYTLPRKSSLSSDSNKTFCMVGHCVPTREEIPRLAGRWDIGSLLLFNGSRIGPEEAFYLYACGPDFTSIMPCKSGNPNLKYSKYISLEGLQCEQLKELLMKNKQVDTGPLTESLAIVYAPSCPSQYTIYEPVIRLKGQNKMMASQRPFSAKEIQSTVLDPLCLKALQPVQHQGLQSVLHEIGGTGAFIFLFGRAVELSDCEKTQALALQVVLSLAKYNQNRVQEMESCNGYSMIHQVLIKSKCIVGFHILKTLLDGCCSGQILSLSVDGQFKLDPESNAVVQDVKLLSEVLLDWKIWAKAQCGVWETLLAALEIMIRVNHPQQMFNVKQFLKAQVVHRFLLTCQVLQEHRDELLTSIPRDVCRSFIKIFQEVLGSPPDLELLRLIYNFLLAVHPPTNTYVCHTPTSFYFSLHIDGKLYQEKLQSIMYLRHSSSGGKSGGSPDLSMSPSGFTEAPSEDLMLEDVMDKLIQPEALIVLVNHPSPMIQQGVMKLLDAYFNRAFKEQKEKFLKNHGFSLLANQVYLHQGNQGLLECFLEMLFGRPVGLDEDLNLEDMEKIDPFRKRCIIPILGLIENSLYENTLVHNTLCILLQLVNACSKVADILLDNGLLYVIFNTLAALNGLENGILLNDYKLLVCDIQQLLVAVTIHSCSSSGSQYFGIIEDLITLLGYLQISKNKRTQEMAVALQFRVLQTAIEFIKTTANQDPQKLTSSVHLPAPQHHAIYQKRKSIAGSSAYVFPTEEGAVMPSVPASPNGRKHFRHKKCFPLRSTWILLNDYKLLVCDIQQLLVAVTIHSCSSSGSQYFGIIEDLITLLGYLQISKNKRTQEMAVALQFRVLQTAIEFIKTTANQDPQKLTSSVHLPAPQHHAIYQKRKSIAGPRRFSLAQSDTLLMKMRSVASDELTVMMQRRMSQENPIRASETEYVQRLQRLTVLSVNRLIYLDVSQDFFDLLNIPESPIHQSSSAQQFEQPEENGNPQPTGSKTTFQKEILKLMMEGIKIGLCSSGRGGTPRQQWKRILWSCKDTFRVQIGRLLVHILCPARPLEERKQALEIVYEPNHSEILRECLSPGLEHGPKLALYLYELFHDHKDCLSKEEQTAVGIFMTSLKLCGHRCIPPKPDLIKAIKEDQIKYESEEKTNKSAWEKKMGNTQQSLIQRLDGKSKDISKIAADITQNVSLRQGMERKKVIQHIRGMYKIDLSASRHWQELVQQLTHDR